MDWQNPHFNFQVPVRKKVHKEVSRLCSFSTFCFITWVCDSRVERRTLSYIPDHRFLVRHESHRLSRSSTQLRFGGGRRGFPKRHINHISKWSRSYLFTPFSPSLKSQSRRCSLFSVLLHLHRSVHQKFHPVFSTVSLLRTYLTLSREASSHSR